MKSEILNDLIKHFSKLPSLGSRSAKRIVLYLLNNKEKMLSIISSMNDCYNKIKKCSICGNFTMNNICEICNDYSRDKNTICIVENITDLWAIENTSIFKGDYHILGGTLSAIDGITPDKLNITKLIERIKKNSDIKEIIIATNPTLDGQTTAFYIYDLLKDFKNLKITKPAYGIPLGSEFNYLDDSTLDIAFKNKKDF